MEKFLDIREFKKFLWMTLSLVGMQWTICLPYFICILYIGTIKNPVPMAAYGITCTFVNLIFTSLLLGVQESMGVRTSKYFTAKNFKGMGKAFFESLFLSLTLATLFALLSLNSRKILLFLNIDSIVAIPTS